MNKIIMKNLIKDGAFLVDVRTPPEFAEQYIENSVNIPLDTVANSLDSFRDKKHIIVFCRSGNRSGLAKSILEQNGFTNVTNGGSLEDIKQQIN